MADSPIIRNLETLRRDMVDELRQILHAIYQYESGMAGTEPPADVQKLIDVTERKTRTVLEFLTGSRE